MMDYLIDVGIRFFPYLFTSMWFLLAAILFVRFNNRQTYPYTWAKYTYFIPLIIVVFGLVQSVTSPTVTYKHETYDESQEYRESQRYQERLDESSDKDITLKNLDDPEAENEARKELLHDAMNWKDRDE